MANKNQKPSIAVVIGTRPEVIRFAPLVKTLEITGKVNVDLIHTGQHYSQDMSQIFFDELKVKPPVVNLEVGSRDPAPQVGEIITRCADVFKQRTPTMVCVWGDTNSSLGAAIATNKLKIKLAHIESGCRSFDTRMAEECNRILIDHISDLLFPLSKNDADNLAKERVMGEIQQMGDPLLDVYKETVNNLKPQGLARKYELGDGYGIFTLHRAESTDNKKTLQRILEEMGSISKYKILFPMHPRTRKMIDEYSLTHLLKKGCFVIVPPLGYLELLELLTGSKFVITDSGGLQKEAFFASRPCITLRRSTEWLDTVKLGVNTVIDPESNFDLKTYIGKIDMVRKRFLNITTYPYGKGNASKKIAEALISYCLNVTPTNR